MRMPSIAIAASILLSASAMGGPAIGDRPSAEQIMAAEGTYGLDNGERLRVFGLDNRLYAQVGNHRKELVVAGPNRFASKDGSITLTVGFDSNGDKVVLGYRPGAQDGIALRMAAATRRAAHDSVD